MKRKMFEKMSKYIRLLLTAIAGCMCLFGCDFIDDILDSEEEKENPGKKIEKAYQKIKLTADSILLSDDPIAGFEAMAVEYGKIKEVNSVEVTSDGLFIELKDEQIVGWLVPPNWTSSPALLSDEVRQMAASTLRSASLRQSGGKKSILILNQTVNEIPERQEPLNQLISDCLDIFADAGWSVTVRRGSQVDLEFLGNSLSGYDAIFYITHGRASKKHTWIYTGQTFNKYQPQKNTAKINTFVLQKTQDESVIKSSYNLYAINSDFITTRYTSDASFDGACVYVVACQSLGGDAYGENTSMADAFISRGASVYLGWYNPNYSGHETGFRLFSRLLEGYTLHESMQYLADYSWRAREYYPDVNWIAAFDENVARDYDDLSVDYETQTIKDMQGNLIPVAYLKYLPSDAGNFRLVEAPFQVNTTGISDLKGSSVTLNGEITSNGGEAVTETGFDLSTEPDVTNGDRMEVEYTGGTNYPEPFTLGYVALTPKTVYYYRAFARNKNGATAYGDVKQFTTLDEQDITEEINKIVPKEIQNEIRNLGLPIHGGGDPPSNLSGTYLVSPNILEKSNFRDHPVGHRFPDVYLTFSEQNNADLTIRVAQTQEGATGQEGTGAYIVGEGNNFTVFVERIIEKDGEYYCKTAEIYSGTMTPYGISNLRYVLVMIDDNGDPGLINNGQGRLLYDSDGISESVDSDIRSASDETRHLPSLISRRKE
jgi:hypothetical protein